MSDLTWSHQLLIVSAVLAVIFCSVRLLRFSRLIEEFETYSAARRSPADKDGKSASIVRAVFDRSALDKHQKILRTEMVFAGVSAVMLMGWLLVVNIVI